MKMRSRNEYCMGSVQGGGRAAAGGSVEFGIALKKWQLTVMFAVPTRCRQF